MNPSVKSSLVLAGASIITALAAAGARNIGLIEEDTATRISMTVIGLVIAWYGNVMPKTAPVRSPRAIANQRLAGYALAVAGLINAAIWIWAPMDYAAELSTVPILIAMAVVLVRIFVLRDPPVRV